MTSSSSSEIVHNLVGDTRVVADHAGSGEEAILCIHGLASRRPALGPLVDVVADHGYRALAPDLRGHGDSQGPRGRLSKHRVLEDLQAWEAWLARQGASITAVIGHSLGGLWALAAQPSLGADAVAVVASPASILRELNPFEEVGYRAGALAQSFAGRVGLDLKAPYPVGPEDTLESQEAIERSRELGLIQSWLPLANVDDLLAVDGPRWAGNLDCPSVVARPTRDRLVDESSTRALYEALPEPKRWLELDGPHECFFENSGRECAEQVVEALLDQMDR